MPLPWTEWNGQTIGLSDLLLPAVGTPQELDGGLPLLSPPVVKCSPGNLVHPSVLHRALYVAHAHRCRHLALFQGGF